MTLFTKDEVIEIIRKIKKLEVKGYTPIQKPNIYMSVEELLNILIDIEYQDNDTNQSDKINNAIKQSRETLFILSKILQLPAEFNNKIFTGEFDIFFEDLFMKNYVNDKEPQPEIKLFFTIINEILESLSTQK